MKIDEKILSTLTDEQKRKVEAAATPEELIALMKEEGYELPGDRLEGAAGGWCNLHCYGHNDECPVQYIH